MPFNKQARSEKATKQLRDKNGHFIPLKPKVKVSGQANLLSDLIKTEDGDNKGSSWLTLTVNHPFRKIIEILQQIKDKQSTKVNLSFTIPLVALPIVILLAFQFGRYQSSCNEYFSSQIGTLQNITVNKTITIIPDNFFLKALYYIPFASDLYKKEGTASQSILLKQNDQGILIDNISNLNLRPFDQSKVIIFGNYNSCTEVLTLDSEKNISNY